MDATVEKKINELEAKLLRLEIKGQGDNPIVFSILLLVAALAFFIFMWKLPLQPIETVAGLFGLHYSPVNSIWYQRVAAALVFFFMGSMAFLCGIFGGYLMVSLIAQAALAALFSLNLFAAFFAFLFFAELQKFLIQMNIITSSHAGWAAGVIFAVVVLFNVLCFQVIYPIWRVAGLAKVN